MWFLLKIHCFVWYIILPLFSSHYFSQEITLGRDNRFSFPPLPLGQRGPGQRGPDHFNTKTIQHGPLFPWPPFSAKFPWVHVSQSSPSEQKYLVYYLELCPTKHVTIYIKWKVFFISVLLGSLRCTHLCIKIKKVHKMWVASFAQCAGPLCPSYWEQIYLAYN